MANYVYINTRATISQDQIYGIVRIRGTEGTKKVQGICSDFFANPDFMTFSREDVFFYGQEKDLHPNFRRPEKSIKLWQDLHPVYHDKTYVPVTNTLRMVSQFAKIPLEKLDLSREQLVLTQQIFNYAFNQIQNAESLKRLDLPKKGTPKFRAVMSTFNTGFPKNLLDLVLDSGFYFESDQKLTPKSLGFTQYNPPKTMKSHHPQIGNRLW